MLDNVDLSGALYLGKIYKARSICLEHTFTNVSHQLSMLFGDQNRFGSMILSTDAITPFLLNSYSEEYAIDTQENMNNNNSDNQQSLRNFDLKLQREKINIRIRLGWILCATKRLEDLCGHLSCYDGTEIKQSTLVNMEMLFNILKQATQKLKMNLTLTERCQSVLANGLASNGIFKNYKEY